MNLVYPIILKEKHYVFAFSLFIGVNYQSLIIHFGYSSLSSETYRKCTFVRYSTVNRYIALYMVKEFRLD